MRLAIACINEWPRAEGSYAGNTATAAVLAGAGLEGCVATGRPHAFDARATPLPGGPEQGGRRLVLATGTPPPAFAHADPPNLDEIVNARPGMGRQDLPAWVDDVLRRKEAQADGLVAQVSDASREDRRAQYGARRSPFSHQWHQTCGRLRSSGTGLQGRVQLER